MHSYVYVIYLNLNTEQTPEIPQEQIQPEITPVCKKPCCQPRIILLLVLGLIIVVGAVYLGIKISRKQIFQTLLPQPAVTPVPTVTSTPDETASWKTYRNEKFGFEMKYPPISEPEEPSSKEKYYIPIVSIILSMSDKLPPNEAPSPKGISLKAINNVDIYEKMPIEDIAKREVMDGEFEYSIKKIVVGSYNATQVDLKADINNLLYFIKNPNKNLIIVVTSDIQSKQIIDQILSTFKFTDQKEAKFVCPSNGWVNCMPILTEEAKLACSGEAEAWYKANCSDFKGFAQ